MHRTIIFLLLCFLVGCFTPQLAIQNQYKDRYVSSFEEGENLISSSYMFTKSKKASGEFILREFYPDSKTMIKYIEYKDFGFSIKHGLEQQWSDFGVLTSEGTNLNGEREGEFITFSRKTGKLISECNFKQGKEIGIKKNYDTETGSLTSQYTFINGEREGEYFKYHEDGTIKDQGEFKADTLFSSTIEVSFKDQNHVDQFKVVEQMPMFGDGCPELSEYEERKKCAENNMLQFIYKSLRYPSDARTLGIEGMAIVQYVIDRDGNVAEVDVVRGLCDSIREEVLRVVSSMPKWVPGVQRGKNVKVLYTLPVRFKLEG